MFSVSSVAVALAGFRIRSWGRSGRTEIGGNSSLAGLVLRRQSPFSHQEKIIGH
jgi:hypothetical protein